MEGESEEKRACVVCDALVDTCLVIEGGSEWFLASLMAMGMPAKVAKALFIYLVNGSGHFGHDKVFATVNPYQPREVPSHPYTLIVCPECAGKANFRVSSDIAAVPCYRQPSES